jgi:hypothetical protein
VSISATINTQNLNPTTGEPTAGSTVGYQSEGYSIDSVDSISIQTVGTYTGALTPQVRNDESAPWVALGANALLNANSEARSATIASGAQGLYVANVAAYRFFRVSANAAVTGSVQVILNPTVAAATLALSAPLPAGSSTVGTVLLGSGTTGPQKAEDAASASADVGLFVLGVRRDAPTISTSAAGDYSELAVGPHGQMYVQTIDAAKRTYSAATKLTTVIAGQVLEIVGAASTTVEINRITLTLNGTAAGKMDFTVNKRSTAATGGTSTTPTKVPYNAADTAAAAAVKVYTVAPTLGTNIGALRQGMLAVSAANVPSDRIKIESGAYAKSFMLTAATQAITVDLAGTVPTGAELAIDVEWTEY